MLRRGRLRYRSLKADPNCSTRHAWELLYTTNNNLAMLDVANNQDGRLKV